MAGENSSDFRFDADDQEPESFYHEELKDLRLEKLSQRVTLTIILLPCLLAVAIYFGYQDLSGRVSQNHDSGSLEIQRLSDEIENLSRIFNEKLITFSTTLSTQDKDFGTSIEGRLFAINKNIDLLQNNFKSLGEDLKRDLKSNQDTIEKLKASKVDKKSQAVAVEKLSAEIVPIKKELKNLKSVRNDLKLISDNIKKLEARLSKKLTAISDKTDRTGENFEQLDRNYKQLESSLNKLSDQTIDRDALALEVFKLKKNLQNRLSDEVSNLNNRLDFIQKEIDDISLNSKTQKHSMKRASKKAIPETSGGTANAADGDAESQVQSGSITEKDLIE